MVKIGVVRTADVRIADVKVLFVRVCVSPVPTTSPVGTAFVAVTAPVPFPCKKFPLVREVAPEPPSETANVPVIDEAERSTAIFADSITRPPSVLRSVLSVFPVFEIPSPAVI